MAEIHRRQFLELIGVGAGAAAAAACQEPVQKVIPYLNQPEEVVPGIATHYYSTCRECPVACSLDVKTREGRPIKVDGNPNDPVGRGALCIRGQASLYRTFDASRFRGPWRREKDRRIPLDWTEAIDLLVAQLRPAAAAGKVYFLGGQETGTLDALIDRFLEAIGSPHRVRFELFAYEALRSANQRLFGAEAIPHFAFDRADLVVSFGTDFLETWLDPLQNQVGFSAGRRNGRARAILVGPRMGLSGSNTDLWLEPVPGSEILVALALAHGVARRRGDGNAGWLARYGADQVASRTGIPAARLEQVAEEIARADRPMALPPGTELLGTNAADFATAVQILNHVSGALGRTVVFGPDHNLGRLDRFRDVKQLAGKMRGGEVGVLLLHGTNPVYAVPQVGFADAMAQPGIFKVSFASADDETTALADLVLPDHTPYESWGDAEPIRGVRRLQQPTVRPLMDTRATGDVLLEVARKLGQGETLGPAGFRGQIQARWGAGFEQALGAGGSFTPAAERTPVPDPAVLPHLRFETAQLGGSGDLTLIAYPSLHFHDGRSARIAMLQEVPDPVLETTWGSFAEMHPETAAERGIERGDVVRVTTEAGSVELPAFPHEAVRPGVVAIAIGQGHQPVDPEAPPLADRLARRRKIGVNVLEILPGRLDSTSGGLAFLFARARIERTGRKQPVAGVQKGFDQEGRGFARVVARTGTGGEGHGDPGDEAEEGRGVPGFGGAGHLETKAYDPADDAAPESPYRWGMAIDLDACTGCGACITACVQENNIPVVGPETVLVGREMHWIRIERYLEHRDGEPEVRHVPMLCQHCGAAPCENVCPVLATYHNPEGLNVMVPNRCIGTRYCSNNCSYKVRRFNYFPYDQAIAPPEHLALNPDVTVRSKGVMEKCTFCVQRINAARDRAAAEGRIDSDGRVVPRILRDGEVVPACAQTCPSQAIAFGNLRDRESRVARLQKDERAYRVLDHLYTRPAIAYLKSIRRDEA